MFESIDLSYSLRFLIIASDIDRIIKVRNIKMMTIMVSIVCVVDIPVKSL